MEKNNKKIIKQIETLLAKAKKTTIPQIQAIKDKTKYFEPFFELKQVSQDNSYSNKEYKEYLDDIQKTSAQIKQLKDMNIKMAKYFEKQRQMREEIEVNDLTTKDNDEKAKKENTDANEMTKLNSKKNWLIIIIVVAIVLFFLMFYH